ncbi:hypothetical protein NC653_023292 [Populus alba x Populus x berolinensis]|uniref:Uncharacterized protein n=1 Tax=Populus alba x Populus x berolinensis TaxID=444605 RepID=A0AAD6MI83_9ROSI|nr:hypothetical protein NC653_023292 [Populus alba x Populus x berolinensis]
MREVMHSLEAREQGEGTIGVWLIHSWLLGASKIPSLPPFENSDDRSWVTPGLPEDTPNLCLKEQACLQDSSQVPQIRDIRVALEDVK